MLRGRWGSLLAALAAGAILGAVLIAVDSRPGMSAALLDEYDVPFEGKTPNDMIDSGMGRHFVYSQGDQDVREGQYMTKKFDRLQSIIDSIHNGPLTEPPPPLPPPPRCGEPGGPICPKPRAPGPPTLSYTQRIRLLLKDLQKRINSAAKRQYVLEDKVASAKKPRGEEGPIGPPGFPGDPGPVGPQGPQGVEGTNGVPGLPGKPSKVSGAEGADGVQGPQGLAGYDGLNDYKPGPKGSPGEPGERGPPGPVGLPGPQGADGTDGVDGAPGVQGAAGAEGRDGTDGQDGLPGRQGPPGARGIAGLTGKAGPPGDEGLIGAPGVPGPKGSPGFPGAPGPIGTWGRRGDVGQRGLPGRNGINGTPGAEGVASAPVGGVRAFGGDMLSSDQFCHFPFVHNGQQFTRCTTQGHDVPWCWVDAEQTRWGNCELMVEAQGGNGEGSSARCSFPFTFRGTEYTQCTDVAQEPGQEGLWCYTDADASSYGVCDQPVAGGTSQAGDVCTTPCTTDYSPRPWCYSSEDRSRWGICLFRELRGDGSWVWV